jgi:hypothetical protein
MLSRRSFLNSTLGAGLALTTAHQATAQSLAAAGAWRTFRICMW